MRVNKGAKMKNKAHFLRASAVVSTPSNAPNFIFASLGLMC